MALWLEFETALPIPTGFSLMSVMSVLSVAICIMSYEGRMLCDSWLARNCLGLSSGVPPIPF